MLQVDFIAEYEEWNRLWVLWHGFHEEFLLPDAQVLKRLRISDVVYEHACLRTTIECPSQALKSFLTGSVPYLQCHRLHLATVHYLKAFAMKICTYCWLVYLRHTLPNVVLYNTGLAHSTVTKHDNLQYMILL